MSLTDQFQQAVTDSRTLTQQPDNETLLKLYALYKQATMGDADPDDNPPNVLDFVGQAKHEAWLGLSGESREAAMEEYVNLVKELKG